MAVVIAMSVDDAVTASGLSRSTIYALIRSGELTSVKQGRRRLITADSLRAHFNRLAVEQGADAA
jgi:excisionase family DNA binding protein